MRPPSPNHPMRGLHLAILAPVVSVLVVFLAPALNDWGDWTEPRVVQFWFAFYLMLATCWIYICILYQPLGPLTLDVHNSMWARRGNMWVLSDLSIVNGEKRRMVLRLSGRIQTGHNVNDIPAHVECLQSKGFVIKDAFAGQNRHLGGDVKLKADDAVTGHVEFLYGDAYKAFADAPPVIVVRDLITGREREYPNLIQIMEQGGVDLGPRLAAHAPKPKEISHSVAVGTALVMPDGTTKANQTFGHRPGQPFGDLPISVDMGTLSGQRHGKHEPDWNGRRWLWEIDPVTIVNNSSDPLVLKAWLVVPRGGFSETLGADPTTLGFPLRLGPASKPDSVAHGQIRFVDEPSMFDDPGYLDPTALSGPLELVFREVGTEREYGVPFNLGAPAEHKRRMFPDELAEPSPPDPDTEGSQNE